MPKAHREPKNKRARERAADQFGVLSGSTLSRLVANETSATPVVIQKLSAECAAEREEACNAVANIVLDAASESQGENVLQRLLACGTIKKLAERLADPSFPVRVAAMGALRNFTLVSDPADGLSNSSVVAEAVYASSESLFSVFAAARNAIAMITAVNVDDKATIQAAQQQNAAALQSSNNNGNNKSKDGAEGDDPAAASTVPSPGSLYLDSIELLEHAIAFLWNLTEVNDNITGIVTNSDALVGLLPFMDLQTTATIERLEMEEFQQKHKNPNDNDRAKFVKELEAIRDVRLKLAKVAAQFFNVVTDANAPAVSRLLAAKPDIYDILRNLIGPKQEGNNDSDPELRALLIGALYNLRQPQIEEELLRFVVPILLDILSFPMFESWINVCAPLATVAAPSPLHASGGEELTNEQEAAIEKVTLDMEKASSFFSACRFALELLTNMFTSSNEEEPIEPEVPEDDNDADVPEGMAVADQEDTSTLSKPLQECLPLALERVLLKCAAVPNQVLQLTSVWPNYLKPSTGLLFSVQLRALSCLGNMLLATPPAMDANLLNNIWNLLCDVCAQASSSLVFENLEAVSAASWTLLRRYKNHINLTPGHLQGLLYMSSNQLSSAVRSAAIGMLGAAGSLPQFKEQIPQIGQVLLGGLRDNTPSVVAEALNAIFDLFAETDYNAVVQQLNMMNELRAFVPFLKNKLRSEKKAMEREQWHRLDEAKINLIRFIDYKRNQNM